MINEYNKMATTILIIIDAIALLVMLFAGFKVYKIDKFRNRFILFMMVFIVLTISFDLSNWTVTKMVDTHDDSLRRLHKYTIALDLATGTSMIIALQLNLRIWLVYLLKIIFMGKVNRQDEAGIITIKEFQFEEKKLIRQIKIVDVFLILWIIIAMIN